MLKVVKYSIGILCLSILWRNTWFSASESLTQTIYDTMHYLQINQQTIANKLYATNKNAKVYFFWSYRFFTINTMQELNQVKKQLNRDNLLALFKDGKVLIISEYLDAQKVCKWIDEETAELLSYYPEKIKTSKNNLFLIGNENDNSVSCYIHEDTVYLPNDELSKVDIKYIVSRSPSLITKLRKLVEEHGLQDLYYYVTHNTSYDYDAVDMNIEEYAAPYLVAGFFNGQKIVCDGYSKMFAFLANMYLKNGSVKRIIGSRQSLDKKNEKAFLHSWIRIGKYHYDPTFDDGWDKDTTIYYAKPQECFNLDHYTNTLSWRTMFATEDERFTFIKEQSNILIQSCPDLVTQILIKNNYITSFLRFLAEEKDVKTLKAFMCDAFSICAIHANEKKALLKELGQYAIHYNGQQLLLSTIFDHIQDHSGDASGQTTVLSPKTKSILDQGIKKLLAKSLFYSPEKRKQYLFSIKRKLVFFLSSPDLSAEMKTILHYIADQIHI